NWPIEIQVMLELRVAIRGEADPLRASVFKEKPPCFARRAKRSGSSPEPAINPMGEGEGKALPDDSTAGGVEEFDDVLNLLQGGEIGGKSLDRFLDRQVAAEDDL